MYLFGISRPTLADSSVRYPWQVRRCQGPWSHGHVFRIHLCRFRRLRGGGGSIIDRFQTLLLLLLFWFWVWSAFVTHQGADRKQTIRAFEEAESFKGTSIIFAQVRLIVNWHRIFNHPLDSRVSFIPPSPSHLLCFFFLCFFFFLLINPFTPRVLSANRVDFFAFFVSYMHIIHISNFIPQVPCLGHGVAGGLTKSSKQMEAAVECGYAVIMLDHCIIAYVSRLLALLILQLLAPLPLQPRPRWGRKEPSHPRLHSRHLQDGC